MRGAIVLLAGLALAAPATAAPPLVTAGHSDRGRGRRRLCLGPRRRNDGCRPAITHVYPSGRFAATVTATGPSGEIARAQVAVVAAARRLTALRTASRRFRARILLRSPGPYHVRFAGLRSAARCAVVAAGSPPSFPARSGWR